jgi:hypothetical protein
MLKKQSKLQLKSFFSLLFEFSKVSGASGPAGGTARRRPIA